MQQGRPRGREESQGPEEGGGWDTRGGTTRPGNGLSPGCLRVSAEPARAARSGPAAGAPNHSHRPPLPDAPPAAADASGSAVPRLRDHSRRPGSRPQFRPARAPGLICAPGREASEVQTAGCSRLLCPLGRSRRDGSPPAATDPRCEAWTERIYEANSCIYTRPGLPPEVGAGAASPSPPPRSSFTRT